jgi:nitroreductase
MFNDTSSALSLLTTRRSGKPRDMVAPGPSDTELHAILAIAARVPDHGKLAPWRFVIVGADQREALAKVLTDAYRASKPDVSDAELETVVQFAHQAPTLVVVLSSPQVPSKIPLWEQELSAGAACLQLLNAATAHGYVGGWLTGWASVDDRVRDAFGKAPEKIAGFVFLGSPGRPLEERPRPDLDEVISRWQV